MKQAIWGLVMAAGKAEQLSSEIETAFLYLNDRPVLAYSLEAFNQCPEIDGVVVVVSRERAESVLGMVVPRGRGVLDDEGWAVVVTYSDEGYVSDDDAANTDYDELLMSGVDRDDARHRVRDHVDDLLDAWRSGVTLLDT